MGATEPPRASVSLTGTKHPDNKIGNFQLSNKEYFDAFVGRCSQMVKDYNMKYFKFDGISTHFHAKGPGNERRMRKASSAC